MNQKPTSDHSERGRKTDDALESWSQRLFFAVALLIVVSISCWIVVDRIQQAREPYVFPLHERELEMQDHPIPEEISDLRA